MSKTRRNQRKKEEVFKKFGMIFFPVTIKGKKYKAFTTLATGKRGYNEVAYYIDDEGLIKHIRMGTVIGRDIYKAFAKAEEIAKENMGL